MRGYVLFTLALAGCSASPATASEAAPVVADPSDSDASVVAIVSPNDADWVCSGEVIAAKVVLTAGHCVLGGNTDKTGWSFEVFFGNNTKHRTSRDRTVRVTEWHVHPVYEATMRGKDPGDAPGDADLAILLLETAVEIPALVWNRAPLASPLKGAPRYVGFGAVAVEDRGQKHAEGATIADLSDGFVEIEAPARGPCHGDSGGPLLLDGTILGVASTGDCVSIGSYTRTDAYADFVASYL
jgi:secreted trypsin-like serine protease